jgi:Flp pilus assembly protein TadD
VNYRTVGSLAVLLLAVGLPLAAIAQSKSRSRGNPAPPTESGLNQETLMLSGTVVTEDGSPLPAPANIERVCSGRVSRDGHSDFKGYFTVSISASRRFQFGSPDSSAEDSDGSGVLGMVPVRMPLNPSTVAGALAGCELRGALTGFRSSSVRIPVDGVGSEVGPINVGTIVLQRVEKGQGVVVSATSLNAPKEAKKAFDKGHRAAASNKLAEAQLELEKAVRLYPQYAAAWQDLGWLYAQQNRLDKARNAFVQANSADGMFVPAYVGLSALAVRESKWADAAESSARATQLDSVDFPVAFYYNALANFRMGNLELAEKSARKAETLGAQGSFPQVSLLLGVMLANRQEYAGAAEQLRAYLKAAPAAPNAAAVRQQLAQLEKLEGTPVKAEATPPTK